MLGAKRSVQQLSSILALGALCCLLCSCHSGDTFVSFAIKNKSHSPLRQVQVDYPAGAPSNGSQSFGVDQLLPLDEYHYKFKATGDGILKLRFTNANGQQREEPGPEIHSGDSGSIHVTIAPDGTNEWSSQLVPHSGR